MPRLCIRNLPPSLDDRGLRRLVVQHVPKEARVRESRVMRDMSRLTNGVGASKVRAESFFPDTSVVSA